MSKTKIRISIGSVISSTEFAFGRRQFDLNNKTISIYGKPRSHIVSYIHSEEERVAHAAKTGEILPKHYDVDLDATDLNRGQAKFVVLRAEMEGGSFGSSNPNNDHPNELHITARRLTPDTVDDRNGEVIEFYYPDGSHMNSVSELEVHGFMEISFS